MESDSRNRETHLMNIFTSGIYGFPWELHELEGGVMTVATNNMNP